MKPINDNDRDGLDQLAEYELPEWLAAEQEQLRQREAEDRLKVAMAVFAIGFAGFLALIQIARHAGIGA